MKRLAVALAAVALVAPGSALAGTGGIEPGPYRTVQRDYDLGRETLLVQGHDWRLHALPTRLSGELTLPIGTLGRRPVVVLLHGAHQSCELPDGGLPSQNWPCRPGFQSVPSYQGYRYAARLLASFGFVVVSLDANPVAMANSGVLTFPDGTWFHPRTWMDLRGKIVDAQLRRLARANRGETGDAVDFGAGLAGLLDLDRVGLVGHSRGGEGVLWASLLPGPHPYRVAAIVALAPVDFFRRELPDVPVGIVLPYCDGDVSDLEGGWMYDDARALRRTQPLWEVLALGGNHNFFNQVWGDETDYSVGRRTDGGNGVAIPPCDASQIGRTRLSRAQQEALGAEIAARFLRGFLDPGADGAAALLGPLGIGGELPAEIAGAAVSVSYTPPTADRLDVVRPEGRPDLRRNLLGGAQRAVGVDAYGVCSYDPGSIREWAKVEGCGEPAAQQAQALAELRIAWSRPDARLVTALPGGRGDVGGFAALALRVALDPSDRLRNPRGHARPFSIVLRDTVGAEARVVVPRDHPAVQYPGRDLTVLGEIRVPLAAFRGVDLTRVASVELRFDRTARGRLLLTDLSFVR